MPSEVPLQMNMFDEGLSDTRTRKQKKAAKEAHGYQQGELFSQKDLAQFGVRAKPELPAIARNGQPVKMELEIQDPRSEEEKELDRQREAEKLTEPLPEFEPAAGMEIEAVLVDIGI